MYCSRITKDMIYVQSKYCTVVDFAVAHKPVFFLICSGSLPCVTCYVL